MRRATKPFVLSDCDRWEIEPGPGGNSPLEENTCRISWEEARDTTIYEPDRHGSVVLPKWSHV